MPKAAELFSYALTKHALMEADIHLRALKLAFNYEWTECDFKKLLLSQLIQKVIF